MAEIPEVVIESPRVTVYFDRKVQVRDYESATASIHIQAPTQPLSGDTEKDTADLLEAIKYAFFQAKTTVFEQLGISFEVTPELVVLEKLDKQLGPIEYAGQKAAPKPTTTTDKTIAWSDLATNPKGWFDNREDKRNKRAPDFKAKNTNKAVEGGTGLWLDQVPSDIQVPEPSAF